MNAHGDVCCYRGVEGRSCAVGCLIDDAHYSPFIEGVTIYGGSTKGAKDLHKALQDSGVPTDDDSLRLLDDLQSVHDRFSCDEWARELAYVANRHKLKIPKVEQS